MTSTKSAPDLLDEWLIRPIAAITHSLDRPTDTLVVAVYARFSVNHGEDSESVETQLRRGGQEAGLRWPGAEVREYADDGYSGETEDRPDYQRLLADIRAGVVHVVLAKNQSRIERHPRIWESFGDTCMAHGITHLHTWLEGEIRVNDVAGEIKSTMNRNYNRQNRANIIDNLAVYAGDGRPSGGRCTGYVKGALAAVDHKGRKIPTLVQVPRQAAAVRHAAQMVLDGHPMTEVAEWLNEQKIPTARNGERWRPSNVRRLLRSPALAGLRIHVRKEKRLELRAAGVHYITLAVAHEHGGVYRGNWTPILDAEAFLAIQRLIDQPGHVKTKDGKLVKRGAPRGANAKYLLSGIARCGKANEAGEVCGTGLTGTKRPNGGPLYICHGSNGGCNGIGVLAEKADEEVGRKFIALLEDHKFRRRLAKGDPHAARRAELVAEIARLDRERKADAADFKAKRISRATANARATEYDEGEAAARAELDALPEPLNQVDPDELIAAWAHSDQRAQRAMLRLILDRVEILPGRGGGQFDPDRVQLHPRQLL